MSRFKIGQRVVALRGYELSGIKKGDEVIVDGFACCPACGLRCIYLFEKTDICSSSCKCGFIDKKVRECFNESNFAPIQSFGEQIEESISKEANEVAEWMIEAIQTKP